MSSGLAIDDSCIEAFTQLQRARKYKWAFFRPNDKKTEIVCESFCEKTKEEIQGLDEEGIYNVFLNELKLGNTCRWAVYDLMFESEGGKRNKVVFVSWCPQTAGIQAVRERMVFAASEGALKNALGGVHVFVQATDDDEVSYLAVLEKARGKA